LDLLVIAIKGGGEDFLKAISLSRFFYASGKKAPGCGAQERVVETTTQELLQMVSG
jgi:hypothetical protein